MSTQDQIDRLIAVRAAEWYGAIRGGEIESAAPDFRRWLAQSPKHLDAFMVIAGQAPYVKEVLQAEWTRLLPLLDRKDPDVRHLQLPATPAAAATPATPATSAATADDGRGPSRPAGSLSTSTRTDGAPSGRRWRRVATGIGLAASVAVLALLLWAMPPRWQHLETTTGEQRTVALTDGSVVNLNARSIVEVRMREHTRDIRLLQGEALFKVAHDETRPFRVHTSTAVVRAVGTEFAVATRRDGTTVTVLEGKVEVAPNADSRAESVTATNNGTPPRTGRAPSTPVAAGQEARVARGGSVRFEPNADVAASVAWLQRKVVFRRTLLEDMVQEVNRYNGAVRLHVDGVTPGVYRFSGTFDANDPLTLAELLGREAGLSVDRRGADIYIRESKVGSSPLPSSQ